MSKPPSEKAMGANEPQNIYFVDFIEKSGRSENELAAIQAAKSNCDLSRNFLTKKTCTTVDQKIESGQLRDDSSAASVVQRANYRAAVTDKMSTVMSWLEMSRPEANTTTITSERSQFHGQIYEEFGARFQLPSQLMPELEPLLTSINQVIATSDRNVDDRSFWVMLTRHAWDPHMQQAQSYIRTIYFKASDTLIDQAARKNETGTSNVTVELSYAKTDGMFNAQYFEQSAKSAILETGNLSKPLCGAEYIIYV